MRPAISFAVAVMLALVSNTAVWAETPAGSRAETALESAAKQNKYLFIFFYDRDDSRTHKYEERVRRSHAENERSGRLDCD